MHSPSVPPTAAMSKERKDVEAHPTSVGGSAANDLPELDEEARFNELRAASSKDERLRFYAEWLATPQASRLPRTKAELATLWGVSRTTLWNYEQEPWLQSEILRRQRSTLTASNLQDVIATLVRQATDPDNVRSVSAAKLIFDFMGQGDEHQAAENVSTLTTAAMREALAAIEAKGG